MTATTVARQGSAAERQPHPSPHRHRVSRWGVCFGLLGAPLAWSLQELVNASLAGHACYPRDVPLATPLWPHLDAMLVAVEALALAIGIAAALVALANWRKSRHEKPGDAHQLLGNGDGRTRFTAMAGVMTSLLFLVAIALAALNLVAVPSCGG